MKNKSLAIVLKNHRLRLGLTLREAGRLVKSNDAYLWQLENNKRDCPRMPTLKKIARGYGFPLEKLLYLAGYTPKPRPIERQFDVIVKNGVFGMFQNLSKAGKEKIVSYLRFLSQEERDKAFQYPGRGQQ